MRITASVRPMFEPEKRSVRRSTSKSISGSEQSMSQNSIGNGAKFGSSSTAQRIRLQRNSDESRGPALDLDCAAS